MIVLLRLTFVLVVGFSHSSLAVDHDIQVSPGLYIIHASPMNESPSLDMGTAILFKLVMNHNGYVAMTSTNCAMPVSIVMMTHLIKNDRFIEIKGGRMMDSSPGDPVFSVVDYYCFNKHKFPPLTQPLGQTVGAPASRAEPNAITLPKLIETFMFRPGDAPEWSMGAGASTPQISWKSSGVENRPNCGAYEFCRRGTTRVLLNGKEMQHLRKRLEPVPWELFMYSKNLAKFGPEEVSILPSCDTVQCAFDFKAAMGDNKFALTEICKAGPASFSQVAYAISKEGKRIYAVVSENLGSGGSSTGLTLFFRAPPRPKDFCSEAKSAE